VIVGVRHAEVWNPKGLVYARMPGFGLSPAGHEAAQELGQALAGAHVVAVVASPQDRAIQTAGALAASHGLTVTVDDRLDEWAFWAHWQGMPWQEIRARDPDLLEAYAADPEAASVGESLATAGGRILEWASAAQAARPEGLTIGVAHEAPLLAALLVGSGRGLAGFHAARLPHLGAIRLLPGPPEAVDLMAWATSC